MKVKVTGSSGSLYWYRDKIGQIFNVELYNSYNVSQFRYKLVGESKYFDLQDVELLKEEENKVQLKKNWSIACTTEQFQAYKETLKAVGYPMDKYGDKEKGSLGFLYWHNLNNVFGRAYSPQGEFHFESLESFLNWHFKPEEPELTEEQKEILELEKIIQEASLRVKKLKEMKK